MRISFFDSIPVFRFWPLVFTILFVFSGIYIYQYHEAEAEKKAAKKVILDYISLVKQNDLEKALELLSNVYINSEPSHSEWIVNLNSTNENIRILSLDYSKRINEGSGSGIHFDIDIYQENPSDIQVDEKRKVKCDRLGKIYKSKIWLKKEENAWKIFSVGFYPYPGMNRFFECAGKNEYSTFKELERKKERMRKQNKIKNIPYLNKLCEENLILFLDWDVVYSNNPYKKKGILFTNDTREEAERKEQERIKKYNEYEKQQKEKALRETIIYNRQAKEYCGCITHLVYDKLTDQEVENWIDSKYWDTQFRSFLDTVSQYCKKPDFFN